MKSISGIIFLVVVLLAVSCKKDVITDDPAAKLSFSTDTLTFDTVFTQLGSATRRFMIYNRNPESILVSSIKIAGGSASNFRINVNGQPGTSFSNIEIRGNDSMFVFAEVTVDPNSLTNPFVIFESVEFLTNGNAQQVVLSAWGQNAYYYRPNLFIDGLPPISLLSDYFPNQSVVNLPSDKPHVIFGFFMA